jgi:hypothetical protein
MFWCESKGPNSYVPVWKAIYVLVWKQRAILMSQCERQFMFWCERKGIFICTSVKGNLCSSVKARAILMSLCERQFMFQCESKGPNSYVPVWKQTVILMTRCESKGWFLCPSVKAMGDDPTTYWEEQGQYMPSSVKRKVWISRSLVAEWTSSPTSVKGTRAIHVP